MKRGILLIVAVALSGCDFLHGVQRTAPIQTEPDVACIESVIWSASGVTQVQHQRREAERPLTSSGLQAPTIVHTFAYSGAKNISGTLQYSKDYKGTFEFGQTLVSMNVAPSQEVVTATRPVMRYIEKAIDKQCGLSGLSDHVTEWCKNVSCPPLQQQ